MFKFSYTRLKQSHEGPWIALDLVMLGLLLINLLWIVFDSLFATQFIQQTLQSIYPPFVEIYLPVHQNFILIDLVFVAVFLSEFCLRWFVAVKRKEYMRWYFFPFIHCYDLIGCIPLGGLRIFRFLRLFSILYRLQKHQIIDMRESAPYRFIAFYYEVLVEELSDRIVIKVINDAQKDISAGSPLLEDISRNVIATRLPILSQWIASVMVHVGESIQNNEQGQSLRNHVQSSVGKAVRNNSQVSTLRLVPVLGGSIEKTLERAVTDIVTQSIVNLLTDLTADKIDDFVSHGLGRFSVEDNQLDQEMLMVVNECLDLVKKHVGHQRWKSAFETSPTSAE
ncbi:ion transporter [Paraglaciecola sp. 25GB23A]|uniref:ion transporter n=1 Tax=Paraglaciecola sp. 25GB23A TaxID=3156068 RepID=UPI0032AEF648